MGFSAPVDTSRIDTASVGVPPAGATSIFGTDGTEFGCDWSTKAVAEAEIDGEAREKILHRNASAMISHRLALARGEMEAA